MTEGCFILYRSCKELKCSAEVGNFPTNLLKQILQFPLIEEIIPLTGFGVQSGLLMNGYYETVYQELYTV